MTERTAVYRLYGADDALLYVGISRSFGARWEQHAYRQPWWPEVHHQTVEWRDTREEADKAETAAIRSEKPRYNIAKAQCEAVAVVAGHMGRPLRGSAPMRVVHVRGDKDVWDEVQSASGGQAAEVTRQFIAWYVGRPGAKRPKRPPRAPDSESR